MDPVRVPIYHVPHILFTRYSNIYLTEMSSKDVLENLSGNPDGNKISTVPYIYCLTDDQVRENEYDNIYFLKVHFEWPKYGFIAEEEKDGKSITYEEYKRDGFIGVKRYFTDMWRYVIFDPESYIRSIFDTGKEELIYERRDAFHIREELLEGKTSHERNDQLVYTDNDSQEAIDKLMLDRIGFNYIDRQRDVFCVSEIARRQKVSISSVVRRIISIVERITVCKASGCWISTVRSDYKRTFWYSLGGLSHSDIFSFSCDVEEDPNIVIKNKNILHSNICELTWGKKHACCCRPMHLRLGTSKENAIHIKVRKNVEQLFDFSPDEMRSYAYHIYSISNLVEKQYQICRPFEKKLMEKRKGNKILIFENNKGNYVQKVIGTPDMGECQPKKEKDYDILGIKALFSEQSNSSLTSQYTEKLKEV